MPIRLFRKPRGEIQQQAKLCRQRQNGTAASISTKGLNFKLDVGLYRLDQQVAYQRYRYIRIDAKNSLTAMVDRVLGARQLATVPVVA